jgi:hypothetical protein
VPKALRGLTDWTRHPVHGEEFRRWSWLPYEKSARAIMRVGQVHFWHGFDAGQSSDELEGLQMIALSGWIPHSLAVRGHTHRPVPPTQARRTAKIPLPYWYANVGTAGPLQPDWAKRKDTSQWNTAILVVDAVWDKPSRLTGKFDLDKWSITGVLLDVAVDVLFDNHQLPDDLDEDEDDDE